MTATVAEFERLYSAAARMLTAQVSPSWRGDTWPEDRRLAWRELEAVLTAGVPVGGPDELPDPATTLVTVDKSFPAAARSLQAYLRDDPDGVDEPVVMPGVVHTAIAELMDELAARLAPGRPPVAVSNDAAVLGAVVLGLADTLRLALGLPEPSSDPAQRIPPIRPPQPLRAESGDYERLVAVAKAAAEVVPAPEQLARDYSVRHGVAVAAADVRGLIAGEGRPAWRERHDDISPEAHLVSGYRWESEVGRPVSFAGRAAELREAVGSAESPWRTSAERALPEPADDRSWILYSGRQALVTAELLDELAARLTPGRWVGTIHFSAYPMQEFITTTLRAGTTEI